MGPSALSPDAFAGALDYISSRPEIWEVIVTGGDPLVLSPRRIAEVTAALAAVPHVKILRWHTRVPVVAPERVTADLAAALRTDDATTYVALHANHPRELSPEARTAIARIVDAGVPMISQTVLLRGINDDAATLEALMRGFVETRVKPYYLHHADLANGTAHLRTTLSDGQQLMDALRGRVSGLCQPTYVLDIPGGFGKVPVGPCYLSELSSADGVTCEVRDPDGRDHAYPPAINHQ
jgi:lysine 2,3-aminomutase